MRGLFDVSKLKKVKEFRNIHGSVALFIAPNDMYCVFEGEGFTYKGCKRFESANIIFDREANKLRGKV